MNNYEKVKALLKIITQKPRKITFDTLLSDFMGDNDGAIVLNQLIFWSDKTSDPDGWMYKTYAEWHEETRLSKYIIYTRTEKLKELNIVETHRETDPYKNATRKLYRFNLEKFIEHLTQYATENLFFSPKQRQKFDEATSKIKRSNVQNLTQERQILNAPNEDASLYTDEYYTDENNQENTNTPPAPPMEQKQPDKKEIETVITPNEINERMQWLDKLGIKSNEWRHKISTTTSHERFNQVIENYNSYIEQNETPPTPGVYALYLLNQPNRHGKHIYLTPCKTKTPTLSPELSQAIAKSCQQKTIISVCEEWESVKRQLYLTMTKATYDTHIRNTTAQKLSDNHYILYTNHTSLTWLENRLQEELKRVFMSVLNLIEITLNFKLKE